VRPSLYLRYLRGLGDGLPLDFYADEGMGMRVDIERLAAMKDAKRSKGKLPPGVRYETIDDLGPLPPGPIVPGPAADL